MICSEKENLQKIKEMANDYILYLTVEEGMPRNEAKDVAIALMALYWQAGEQMEYLSEQIENEKPDGKQFCMLVGFAYSILDSLEVVAERAHIGKKEKNGYVIESHTNIILHKNIFENISEEFLNDWRYLKFLRSLICAHPMETNHRDTIRGFLPGDNVFCQYVDRINPKYVFNEADLIYDYRISLLYNSNNKLLEDIKLVSSEIWNYVEYRYKELVKIICDAVFQRNEQIYSILKSKPIVQISESYDSTNLDEIIEEDWQRNGSFHQDLMRIKVLLQQTGDMNLDTELKSRLIDWLWNVVHELHEKIQLLDYNNSFLTEKIDEVLKKIGFDLNQMSNFSYLDSYNYGIDSSNYIEEGLNNYESLENEDISCAHFFTLPPEKREDFYNLVSERIKGWNRQDRIELVSEFYRCPKNYVHEEVARFFIVVVLTDFVKRYDLHNTLVNASNYELYVTVLACAIDYSAKIKNGEVGE